MGRTFYRLLDDTETPGRWWLKAPRDAHGAAVEPDIFRLGKRLELACPLTIPVRRPGRPLDFTFGDFELPVVSETTGILVRRCARGELQSFPAVIEGHGGRFEVLNLLRVVRCLDEEKSDVMFWTEADGRPGKVGQYRQVVSLTVDPAAAGKANLFRIAGWEIALIASEAIRGAMQRANVSGVRFAAVC